jgi:hypothetical protein
MIKRLNEVNDVKVFSVFDDEFKTFGRIHTGYDVSALVEYMKAQTSVPESGNVYVPSVAEMESTEICGVISKYIYGDMPIQIGYCNGRNSTYNGFEYHKCSELNIAVTDFMLVLGHIWQIEDNRFNVGDEKVFYVPEGTVLEMYQTTLHLSPCKVCDSGFMDIVVLAKGTNTPLAEKPDSPDGEERLLLQRNKWVISHKEREPLMKQGAYPGLIGENKELKY